MPALGVVHLDPHDNRLTGTARNYVSTVNWQDGYYSPCGNSNDGVFAEITRVVLGDGETVYALGQYAVDTGSEAWAPGKDVLVLSLTPSDASGDHTGGGVGCLHIYISQTLSAGQVGIYAFYNNAGTNVTTSTYYGVSTNLATPDTWGVSLKKFNDAGTWKLTVTLRVNGVDQATQTTSFGGTEPSIDFGTVHHGYLVTQGKGQTGIVDIGGVRVHTDSSYPESGTQWTLTDCDNIFNAGNASNNAKIRRPAVAAAFDAQFYTVNALIYYGASGQNFNTWPDTNCKVKTLIPSGDPDETEMLTNAGATGTYTTVDDIFGGA